MKNKEELLNVLDEEGQNLSAIAKKLQIQYYQAKIIVQELVREGKVFAIPKGKRFLYAKLNGSVSPANTPQ